jgi:hypothetical protein
MPILSPTVPSAVDSIRPSSLNPTLNNRAFYTFSGIVGIDGDETTVFSINDIGKRDIILCLELGSGAGSGDDFKLKIYSNGTAIFEDHMSTTISSKTGFNELKMILPRDTSLELTLENKSTATSRNWTVIAYGYYLESA